MDKILSETGPSGAIVAIVWLAIKLVSFGYLYTGGVVAASACILAFIYFSILISKEARSWMEN